MDSPEFRRKDLPEDEYATLDSIVWRKLDKLMVPLCTIFFLVANLDKQNIANARLAGLQESLAMSDHQYSMALTVYAVPHIVSQFPSALLLKYVGPDIMLPAMVTLWGVIAASQGLVHNYSGLLVCRFLLGMFDGGLFPGIILYLSSFYPPERLQTRIAAFFSLTLLSAAFSGLLAAAIEQMDGKGGKPGWAWMFILEGAFTFVFGMVSYFFFPRSPEKDDVFSWTEIIGAAKSPHVWLLAIVFFFSGTTLFGLLFFEPMFVAGLGYRGDEAQLMSVPPFAITFFLSPISAAVSDSWRCRGYAVIFFAFLKTIGFIMFYVSRSARVRYASLFFSITGAACVAPPMIAWLANNSAPHTRRATAVAMTSIMLELGGLFTTWLAGPLSPPPDYIPATITFIAMSVTTVLVSLVNLAYLRRENRSKAEKRGYMKKEDEPKGLGDRSAWFVYGL